MTDASLWDDDEDGLIALLRKEAPNAAFSSLVMWRERLHWAAEGCPMDREEWKQAKQALADLSRHLDAARAAEAALPSWLRRQVAYRKPTATMTEVLAEAMNVLRGKIDLGERIVAAHYERNPPRRGNPSFVYSEGQLAVARTAAIFWQEAAGKIPTPGRDAEGLPTSDFGRFLEMVLDKLELDGSAPLLAEKVLTPIPE